MLTITLERLKEFNVLSFAILHDISSINTKFDNNRRSTFGDYLSNNNRDGRQTDGNWRPTSLYSRGREN